MNRLPRYGRATPEEATSRGFTHALIAPKGHTVSYHSDEKSAQAHLTTNFKKAGCKIVLISALLAAASAVGTSSSVSAHDIYIGVHGKNGQLCCGGNDCAATVYKLVKGDYYFLTREDQQAGDAQASEPHWVKIPEDRITFQLISGDPDTGDDQHHAHMCYRLAMPSDVGGPAAGNIFDNIFLYCAFIPPGSI